MPLAQPFTKKLITSEYVALKAIQFLSDTFFDIINSVENISVQALRWLNFVFQFHPIKLNHEHSIDIFPALLSYN